MAEWDVCDDYLDPLAAYLDTLATSYDEWSCEKLDAKLRSLKHDEAINWFAFHDAGYAGHFSDRLGASLGAFREVCRRVDEISDRPTAIRQIATMESLDAIKFEFFLTSEDEAESFQHSIHESRETLADAARVVRQTAAMLRTTALGGPGNHRRYSDPDNYDRDEWLYNRRLAGDTLKTLQSSLEDKQSFELLTSYNGIRNAIAKYCEFRGLPVPEGKRGRPSSR